MWLLQSVNVSAASSKRILPLFEQPIGSAQSGAFIHICLTIEAMVLCVDTTNNFQTSSDVNDGRLEDLSLQL